MTTTQPRDFVADSFKQITDSFSATMRAGMKLHEETARFWTDAARKNVEQFRANWDKLNDDVLPFSRRNVERFHRMFDEQATKALDLLRQSTEGTQQASNPGEVYDRLTNVWRSSFDSLRGSADAMAKANAEMFENWSELMRTNGANGKTAPKPAQTK